MGKQIKRLASLFLLVFCANTALGQRLDESVATRLSLGRVLHDQSVENVITFNNPTGKTLEIENVQFTSPLLVRNITPIIEHDGQGQFTLALEGERSFGEYEGIVRIHFKNEDISPIAFVVEAYIVPPIEFNPGKTVNIAAQRGEKMQASIEIINHRDRPLGLTGIDYESDRFTASLHTLDPGKRYRLDLDLSGHDNSGHKAESISLLNDDETLPPLNVMVNTLLRDKVYTFPGSVDLGALPLNIASDQDMSSQLTQTLMIYRPGTKNFEIDPTTDLDSIKLTYARGSDGDRFQISINLEPGKVTVGPVHGLITINTNDQDFPVIKVPVNGVILPARTP